MTYNPRLCPPLHSLLFSKESHHQSLAIDGFHLWSLYFPNHRDELSELVTLLSEDEQQRAKKFLSPSLQEDFILARASLRILLSMYLQTSPEKIVFTYSEEGKPRVEEQSIQFNLSHSHQWAVFGFSLHKKIGVDIEYKRDIPHFLDLATRFFSPEESEQIKGLPVEKQKDAFFACWTRKEAFVKAIGLGMAMPLEQFEVSVGEQEPSMISVSGNKEAALRWDLQDIFIAEEYAGTICLES